MIDVDTQAVPLTRRNDHDVPADDETRLGIVSKEDDSRARRTAAAR
jgi:hypothetical protein